MAKPEDFRIRDASLVITFDADGKPDEVRVSGRVSPVVYDKAIEGVNVKFGKDKAANVLAADAGQRVIAAILTEAARQANLKESSPDSGAEL